MKFLMKAISFLKAVTGLLSAVVAVMAVFA